MDIDEYIETHSTAESELLQRITHTTNLLTLSPHMLSGHIQGRFLSMLSYMLRPRRILEIGSFTGYSALCLAEGLTDDGLIDTIEHNDELESLLQEHLSASPYHQKIRVHIGDALSVISTLSQEVYDLVFIDADKRQYAQYYDAVLPLVREGGFIIADNTLWDGHVLDKAYDKDKQTLGLRCFNDKIARDERVEKVILPLRDGLTIIRKTK